MTPNGASASLTALGRTPTAPSRRPRPCLCCRSACDGLACVVTPPRRAGYHCASAFWVDPDRHDHLKPVARESIAAAARARGLGGIDAPVSGGDVGARDAKLSIMIGGDESDVEGVMPIPKLMGTDIRRQGGPGAGQHTKLANQIVIAGTMLGVAEGLAYARRVGLDPHAVLASIRHRAAGCFLLNMSGPRNDQSRFCRGIFRRA